MKIESKREESSLSKDLSPRNEASPQNGARSSLSYEEAVKRLSEFNIDEPKLYDESVKLFNNLQRVNNLSNNDLERLFDLIEEKLDRLWIPFMVKVSVSICHSKSSINQKIISIIRTKAIAELEKHGIPEGELTTSEKNFNIHKNVTYVIQFLSSAEKYAQKKNPISAWELACLSFICFSLACKQYYVQDSEYLKTQLLIDRSVAEYLSSPSHTTVNEKDLAANTLGLILSAKAYYPKKVSELTFLYSGTSERLSIQESQIQRLENNCKSKSFRINSLIEEIKTEKAHSQELQQQIGSLIEENKQLTVERSEAENLLSYEKNKYQKQLQSQEQGIAAQLSATISLELEALKDLVQYLDEDDQRRFSRRLNRIDQYLHDFGGET